MIPRKAVVVEKRPSRSIRFFDDEWSEVKQILADPKLKTQFNYPGSIIHAAVSSWHQQRN